MSEHAKLVIIGSGPAGYTAAIYAARAGLQPVVFAGPKSGGQLMWTSDVENYPGFAEGINGPELMFTMRAQAERFGAIIKDEYVTALASAERPFQLWTHLPDTLDANTFERVTAEDLAQQRSAIMAQPAAMTADAIIVTTGAYSILSGVPGEQELLGKGVSTCAVCDAAFYRDKQTFVIGGGDSAMEDALALTKFARSVTLVHRRDSFRASKIMQERVLAHPRVTVLFNSQISKVNGEQQVTGITIKNLADNTEKEMAADGVFVAIGHRPMTHLFADQLELDGHGYIVTRQSMTAPGVARATRALSETGLVAYASMTSVEGIFAAGDVVDVHYKQAIVAAGQGCTAALDAERWLDTLAATLG